MVKKRRSEGIIPSWGTVLISLDEYRGFENNTMRQIVERSGLTATMIYKKLEILRDFGYVTFEKNYNRKVNIYLLTPNGIKVSNAMKELQNIILRAQK